MLETKEQSKIWKEKAEEVPQKFKTVPPAGKMMLAVFWFWNHRGSIYWEFEDNAKSRVSKNTYFDTVNNPRNAVKSKRSDLLSRKMYLLYDNVKPRATHLVRFLLKNFKWKMLKPSPYLPDLAPGDYYLFARPRKALRGQWFATRKEIVVAVKCILRNLDGRCYQDRLRSSCLSSMQCLQKMGITCRSSKFSSFSNILEFFGLFLHFSPAWQQNFSTASRISLANKRKAAYLMLFTNKSWVVLHTWFTIKLQAALLILLTKFK